MTRRKRNANAQPPLAASNSDRLQPWLLCCMTAMVVARPLFPSESAAAHGDGLTMVMLWISLCVLWLLRAVGRPKSSVRFGCTDAAVLLLIGWHSVAAIWAIRQGSPRPAANMLWEWIGMGLCFLLARQFITTPREVRAVAAVMVALAAGLSGYGLYQRVYEMPQTRAEYAADPDRAMRIAGLWFPPGSHERKLFESRVENQEPLATFALTNSLAAFLSPWLVVLVGMGLSVGRNRKRLLGMGLCLIPIAMCLVLTKSRSGYIASCVGLTLAWLLCRAQSVRIGWKLPATIVGIAALLLATALAVDGADLFGKAWKSFGFRVQYWQSSVQMIGDHPLVGCGPGNFQNVYTQYKLPEAAEEVADPHNFLLEVAATAGLPAAACFAAVLACFFGATWMREREERKGNSEGKTENSPLAVGSRPEIQNQKSKTANLQSPISNSSPDAWAYVLAGGAAGFLLSVPVGLLSAAPPGGAAVLLGLPLAAATVGLLWGWIRDGRLPKLLPAVGVVVLLVDLLTTGGIGLPSVAGTLWLLLALGLEGERPRTIPAFAAWAALLMVIGLAVTCYKAAYAPVLECQAQLRMAEQDPAQAVEHLAVAAAADPWAVEPWRQLAAVEFERWWQEPSPDAFDRFRHAAAKVVELTPNSAPTWLAVGDWYFRAFSKTDRQGKEIRLDTIRNAQSAYGEAVRLYPNNASYRTKLAEACQAAGDEPASHGETP